MGIRRTDDRIKLAELGESTPSGRPSYRHIANGDEQDEQDEQGRRYVRLNREASKRVNGGALSLALDFPRVHPEHTSVPLFALTPRSR